MDLFMRRPTGKSSDATDAPVVPVASSPTCQACQAETTTVDATGSLVFHGVVSETCQTDVYCSAVCRDWDKWNAAHDHTGTTGSQPAKMASNGRNHPLVMSDNESDDEEVDDVQSLMDEESMALSHIQTDSTTNNLNNSTALNAITEESNISAEISATDASWRENSIVEYSIGPSQTTPQRAIPKVQESTAVVVTNQPLRHNSNTGSPEKPQRSSGSEQGSGALASYLHAQNSSPPLSPNNKKKNTTGPSPTKLNQNTNQSTPPFNDEVVPTTDTTLATSPSKASLKSFRDSYNIASDSSSTRSQRRNRSSSLVSVRASDAGSIVPEPKLVRGSSLKDFRELYNSEQDDTDFSQTSESYSAGVGTGGTGWDQWTKQPSGSGSSSMVLKTSQSDEVSSLSSKSSTKKNQEMISVLGDLCVLGGVPGSSATTTLKPTSQSQQPQHSPERRSEQESTGWSTNSVASPSMGDGPTLAQSPLPPGTEGLSSLQLARLRNQSMRNSLNSALLVYEQLYGEDAAKSVFQKLTHNVDGLSSSKSVSLDHEQKSKEEENYDWKRVKSTAQSQRGDAVQSESLATTNYGIDGQRSGKDTQQTKLTASSITKVFDATTKTDAAETRGTSAYPSTNFSSMSPRYMKYRASLSSQKTKGNMSSGSMLEKKEDSVADKADLPLSTRSVQNSMSQSDSLLPKYTIPAPSFDIKTPVSSLSESGASDVKVSSGTPVRSNTTAGLKQPSASQILYKEYRDSLTKKEVVDMSNIVNTDDVKRPDERVLPSQNPRDWEEKKSTDELLSFGSPTDSEAKRAPSYLDYRASLLTNKSRSYTTAPKVRVEGAPARKNVSAADSSSLSRSKTMSSKEETVMSSFSDAFLERTNTAEFLEVWNEVESDRSKLEAKIAAAKKSAQAEPVVVGGAENMYVSSLPNNSHLYTQTNAATTSCMPPLFNKRKSSQKDDIDVESGYMSAKANSSEHDGDSTLQSQHRGRGKILRCSILACLLLVIPLAIAIGVIFGSPNRRKERVASSGSSGLAEQPGVAPTTSLASASLSPTSTYEPVFAPTVNPIAVSVPTESPATGESGATTDEPVNATTAFPTPPSMAPTRLPMVTTTFPVISTDFPTATASQSPTTLASRAPSILPTTESPTRMPTPMQDAVAEDLFRLLVPLSSDKGVSLTSLGSPQNLAFQWLASDRNIFANLTSDRILQRYALATFYHSTDGNNWLGNDRWLTDSDECSWLSQTTEDGNCDGDGLYLHLNQSKNDLTGIIPPEIALLTRLQSLLLHGGPGKTIAGTLPSELGSLTSLQTLDIQANALLGAIPTEIGSLQSLETLNLSDNKFSSSIGTEICSLPSLRVLDLASNALTGEIQAGPNAFTNLEILSLADNQLSGPVRIASSLSQLKTLQLERNAFTSLDFDVGRLRTMETFSISDNRLTGTLGSSIGNLVSLKKLSLHTNSLSGPIPSQIGQLTTLEDLNLSVNALTGTIPTEIGLLVSLIKLDLHGNQLIGPIPEELGNLRLTTHIKIHENNITGPVSDAMCDAFSNFFPIFHLDCGVRPDDATSEITCPAGPCCTFCCNDETGCQCVYENTNFDFLCTEDR